jgi:hypothetical protein
VIVCLERRVEPEVGQRQAGREQQDGARDKGSPARSPAELDQAHGQDDVEGRAVRENVPDVIERGGKRSDQDQD